MAMNKDAMKAKIKAAYAVRTGKVMAEGDFNALIDICQGIIEELLAGAVITGTVTSGTGTGGTVTGVISS